MTAAVLQQPARERDRRLVERGVRDVRLEPRELLHGLGSPLGWLCAMRMPGTFRRTASVKSSAIRTDVPATFPQ
jgi:hypothetical protein